MSSQSISVLFVCLGNICRSPAAEGTFLHLVREAGLDQHFKIDSCGTAGYHNGEPANATSRKVARQHGINLPSISRQLQANDFQQFAYIMAMDRSNYQDILSRAHRVGHRDSGILQEQIFMFRQFDPQAGYTSPDQLPASSAAPDVPDPYYGGRDGFEEVQQIMLRTSRALLDYLAHKHGLQVPGS